MSQRKPEQGLASWLAGASGNPGGKALRGRSLAEAFRRIGGERIRFPPEGEDAVLMTRREAVARMVWSRALFEGDLAAVKVLLEYLEGKPGSGPELAAPLRFTADDLARAEAMLAAWLAQQASGGEEDA